MSERVARSSGRGARPTGKAGPAAAPPSQRRWRPSLLEAVVLLALLLVGLNFLSSASRSTPEPSVPAPVAAVAPRTAPPPPEEPAVTPVEPTSSFSRMESVGGTLRDSHGAPIRD